jgi:hypothetical protein
MVLDQKIYKDNEDPLLQILIFHSFVKKVGHTIVKKTVCYRPFVQIPFHDCQPYQFYAICHSNLSTLESTYTALL